MSNIFISYSRADEEKVANIVNDIESLGHDAWFDHELTGGQNWWDKILEEIRSADIFVFILSPESRESTACRREYDYAHALGKPIIPIQVVDGVSTSLLPPALSQVQIVDYLKPNRDAAFRLARSLNGIQTFNPLPDPLPEPPEVPLSYLGSITHQIESNTDLNYQQQSALLLDIKQCLRDSDVNEEDTLTLLTKLRKRRDLFASIADELDAIIENIQIPDASFSTKIDDSNSELGSEPMEGDYERQPAMQTNDNMEGYKVTMKDRLLMSLVYGIIGTCIFFLFLYFHYDERSYLHERYYTFISYILERVIARGEFIIAFIPFAIAGAINGKHIRLLILTTSTALILGALLTVASDIRFNEVAVLSVISGAVVGIIAGLTFIIKRRRSMRRLTS
ncbi:MAG: toll/interleukin-1 receptor domain-containing protein [Thiotrichaceae bacterium]